MKKIANTALLVFSVVAFQTHAEVYSPIFEKKDSLLTQDRLQEVAKSITPAIQIAYLDRDKITHYNYGYKDIRTKEPIDSETVFQAASLSKVVATYAFLILADKGLLDLDKPLWGYQEYDRLRNDPYKELMTARHVLTHQTGLVNWEASAGSEAWRASELKTRFKPGTDYLYSGEAYYYLQMVAEKITGKTLDEICRAYIFDPFGMTKSSFVFTEEFGENIAIGHKDMVPAGRIHKFKEANSAYTLYTTADEYMKFLVEAVFNGKGLSKELHQQFLTPKVATATKGKEKKKDDHVKCCLGIRSMDNEEGRSYWHTGSNGAGFQCVFLIYPDNKKAIAIFTNSNRGRQVNRRIFEKVFGKKQTYWLTEN